MDRPFPVPSHADGLGDPPPDRLQCKPQQQGTSRGLSRQRFRLRNRAADVQRRRRQHDPLERPLPALSSVRLPYQDPRRRRRRLAADIRRPRALLRHQRPHHGRRGHDGRHRLPAQVRAPDPAAPARTPGQGHGPGIRQARLALVALGRHHPDRPLRRTRRLQQLRTVRHRLHSPRQGFHRRHILAQGAGARRADSRPTAESERSP